LHILIILSKSIFLSKICSKFIFFWYTINNYEFLPNEISNCYSLTQLPMINFIAINLRICYIKIHSFFFAIILMALPSTKHPLLTWLVNSIRIWIYCSYIFWFKEPIVDDIQSVAGAYTILRKWTIQRCKLSCRAGGALWNSGRFYMYLQNELFEIAVGELWSGCIIRNYVKLFIKSVKKANNIPWGRRLHLDARSRSHLTFSADLIVKLCTSLAKDWFQNRISYLYNILIGMIVWDPRKRFSFCKRTNWLSKNSPT